MSDPHLEASLALVRQLAREEAAQGPPPAAQGSPAKRSGGSSRVVIDLCSPDPPKKAREASPAAAEGLTSKAYLDCPSSKNFVAGEAVAALAERAVPVATPLRTIARALSAFGPRLYALASVLPMQHDDWTCGYANLSALLQCISRAGRQRLPTPTEAVALQALVEDAWREGFDPTSAAQFGGRLVGKRGRGGWIGAPEIASVLWHLRVDAMIVEVVVEARAGASCSGGAVLDVVQVTSLPIVLQHQSHSRTLLGLTTSSPRGGPMLVLRDPAKAKRPADFTTVAPATLDGQSYQLVFVRDGGERMLSEAEARSRMVEDPPVAAIWRRGQWTMSPWCPLQL